MKTWWTRRTSEDERRATISTITAATVRARAEVLVDRLKVVIDDLEAMIDDLPPEESGNDVPGPRATPER